MKLSPNFWLHEFIRSETAIRDNIEEQFRPLPKATMSNLRGLVKHVLQPLRAEYNSMIYPTSGYRCERLNIAVGGSKNSDHMRGMAVDVTCKSTKKLYELAVSLGRDEKLPFKQLIFYPAKNIVHISYDRNDIRRQAWTTFK